MGSCRGELGRLSLFQILCINGHVAGLQTGWHEELKLDRLSEFEQPRTRAPLRLVTARSGRKCTRHVFFLRLDARAESQTCHQA